MTRMIQPRTLLGAAGFALTTALIAGGAPATAQGFDIRSWFSPPSTATATPPDQTPSPDAPREWTGESGASGHPLMQAGAIRAAAANFRQCLEEVWPLAQKRNVPRPVFDQLLAGVTPELRIMDLLDSQPEFSRAPWEYLDGLVSDGTINQDQEDKIIQAFKDAKDAEHEQHPGAGPLGRRGHGVRPGHILEGMVDVAANTIGVQPSDLTSELKNGKSVADVATEHTVDPQTVVQAIVDAGNKKIDEAVANDKLTSTQADKLKSHLPDAATKFVNHTRPNC